jgi:hypothetical protein
MVDDPSAGCTTCNGNHGGHIEAGFRLAVKAGVLSLNLDTDLLVPEFSIIGEPINSRVGWTKPANHSLACTTFWMS